MSHIHEKHLGYRFSANTASVTDICEIIAQLWYSITKNVIIIEILREVKSVLDSALRHWLVRMLMIFTLFGFLRSLMQANKRFWRNTISEVALCNIMPKFVSPSLWRPWSPDGPKWHACRCRSPHSTLGTHQHADRPPTPKPRAHRQTEQRSIVSYQHGFAWVGYSLEKVMIPAISIHRWFVLQCVCVDLLGHLLRNLSQKLTCNFY